LQPYFTTLIDKTKANPTYICQDVPKDIHNDYCIVHGYQLTPILLKYNYLPINKMSLGDHVLPI